MNAKLIIEAIDTATATLKADNDRAEYIEQIRATDPWRDMAAVMRKRAEARRVVEEMFIQLRKDRGL